MNVFASTRIERAWEAPEEVVLSRGIVETRGLQPEDVGVLAILLLRNPSEPITMKELAASLRGLGWKMGEDRFRAIFGRLKKAGHVRHDSAFNPALGRPEWSMRVYRNPANNTQYVELGLRASTQVSDGNGVFPIPGLEPPFEDGETRVSAGQSGNGVFPVPEGKTGKPRFRETRVSAGQSRKRENPVSASSPPHPQEEVKTSSPYPRSLAGVAQPASPEEGEGGRLSAKDVDLARDVLLRLPAPWTAGLRDARKHAPALAKAAAEQGWALDDPLLPAELTRNMGPVTSHSAVLPSRCTNLRLREVVQAPASGRGLPGQRADSVPPPPYCGDLDCDEVTRLRSVPDAKGLRVMAKCPQCHPDGSVRS